jgi:hypothetical protein
MKGDILPKARAETLEVVLRRFAIKVLDFFYLLPSCQSAAKKRTGADRSGPALLMTCCESGGDRNQRGRNAFKSRCETNLIHPKNC